MRRITTLIVGGLLAGTASGATLKFSSSDFLESLEINTLGPLTFAGNDTQASVGFGENRVLSASEGGQVFNFAFGQSADSLTFTGSTGGTVSFNFGFKARLGIDAAPTGIAEANVVATLGTDTEESIFNLLGSALGGTLATDTINVDTTFTLTITPTGGPVQLKIDVTSAVITGVSDTGATSDIFNDGRGVRLLSIDTTIEGLSIDGTSGFDYNQFIPEPASAALVGVGVLLLVGRRRG